MANKKSTKTNDKKSSNVKNKNMKKEVEKKIDEMESTTSIPIYRVLKIVFGVIVFLGVFYLITLAIVGYEPTSDGDDGEVTIQYEEILAGSSFTMRGNEYLVAYYDYTSDEASELYSAIYSYYYYNTESKKIYSVDMSNGFNSRFVSEESNKNPQSASELAINGPTLISFKDGKVDEYIEGSENIIDYLS